MLPSADVLGGPVILLSTEERLTNCTKFLVKKEEKNESGEKCEKVIILSVLCITVTYSFGSLY
jgi:hypothetical protein